MSPKNSSHSSHFKQYVVVDKDPKFTIYSECGKTKTLYDPRKPADIKRLTKAANLVAFLKDNPKANYPHLLVFESGRYARGVVANEPIKKNQIICEYLGEVDSLEKATSERRIKKMLLQKKIKYPNADFNSIDEAVEAYSTFVSAYAFELTAKSGPNDCMLAHRKRSLAAFINHHTTDPNVHVDVVKRSIRFIASRPIEKGEQLRIDYGPDYEYSEGTYYIPNTDNHLRRGQFLAENLAYYSKLPVKLSKQQQDALGTADEYVLLPNYLVNLLSNHDAAPLKKLSSYEKRLPIIELHQCIKNKSAGYTVYVSEHQQNGMPLLYSGLIHDAKAIDILIKDPSVDMFSKTALGKDLLIVLLSMNDSEKKFLQLAKPLLRVISDNVKRIDYLGTDDRDNTALHILVERDWHEGIRWFNNKIFFSVVDRDEFDPLMLAIALGHQQSLKALLKLPYVKKHFRSLFLSREEVGDDVEYTLMRALRGLSAKKMKAIMRIILQAVKKNTSVFNEIKKMAMRIGCDF